MQSQIDYKKVGQRIKQARNECGMTQDELSTLCGCSTAYFSRCENGRAKVSLSLLFTISVKTGRGVDYFLMDSPSSDPNIKIDSTISSLLQQCSAEMLTLVEHSLKELVDYDQSIRKRLEGRAS